MASRNWNGNAQGVYDVWSATLGGTVAIGDTFSVTCSDKTFTYTAASAVIATERAALIVAFNALSQAVYPELKEATASASATAGVVLFTANKIGYPIVFSVSKVSAAGTWTISNTTVATGQNYWNNAGNWVENTVPVTGDDVFISDNTPDILFGLAQSAVTLNSMTIYATAKNKIGLPRYNTTGGYSEYRQTELAISITTADIGIGPNGSGSPLIKLNTGTVKTIIRIHATAAAGNDGTPAFQWRGLASTNDSEITVNGGSVGIGFNPGDAASVKKLYLAFKANSGDTTVDIGQSVTLTATGSLVRQSGGTVRTLSGIGLDWQKTGGDLYIYTGGGTSLVNWDGTVRFESPGATIATVKNRGVFQRLNQLVASTITNQVLMEKGSSWLDKNGSLTLSGGFTTVGCDLSELKAVTFGFERAYTVA